MTPGSNPRGTECFATKDPYSAEIDLRTDFVIVEVADKTAAERCRTWKEKGYRVLLAVSLSRCIYPEYLNGSYDDIVHTNEVQTDRQGNPILYGPNLPYIIPTVGYLTFLYRRILPCIDEGIDGVVLTEPEFTQRGGYSEAFRDEWEMFYRKPWQRADESIPLLFKVARLKADIFRKAVYILSSLLKGYASARYAAAKRQGSLSIFVEFRGLSSSLKAGVVSVEGQLISCPYLDGYIIKPSGRFHRSKIIREGKKADRSFAAAYLEYGYLGEFLDSSDRQVWLPQIPREENMSLSQEEYRHYFQQNLVATLLGGKTDNFYFCSNPAAIFNRPVNPISAEYFSELEVCLDALKHIGPSRTTHKGEEDTNSIGLLVGDSAMYQRTYPGKDSYSTAYTEDIELLSSYYGLAMPFLDRGISVRPIPVEQISRTYDYLNDYNVLLLSYEYFKPTDPSLHYTLGEWVRSGGILLYMGTEPNPFDGADEWWKEGRHSYPSPLPHLLETLGISLHKAPSRRRSTEFLTQRPATDFIWEVGDGIVGYIPATPILAAREKDYEDLLVQVLFEAAERKGISFRQKGFFTALRGEYRVVKVLENAEPFTVSGYLVDLFDPTLPVSSEVTLGGGECGFYYDIDAKRDDDIGIIAVGAGVEDYEIHQRGLSFVAKAPPQAVCPCRLFFPHTCEVRINGESIPFTRDKEGKTVYFSFQGATEGVRISAVRKK